MKERERSTLIFPTFLAIFLLLTQIRQISSQTVTHIGKNCEILLGFDVQLGCIPSAFQNVANCSKLSENEQNITPCIIKYTNGPPTETTYTVKIFDHLDTRDLTKIVVGAEGSGWGILNSASLGTMRISSMSQNSISFVIGQEIDINRLDIQNEDLLLLTEGAMALLDRDPEQFLKSYGPHYIYSVSYGGSFFGVYNLYERTTSSRKYLDVYAKMDPQSIFYSASGSAQFKNQVESDINHMSIDLTIKIFGGVFPSVIITEPIQLGMANKAWINSITSKNNTKSGGIKIVWHNWYAVAQVQQIVNKKNQSIIDLFLVQPPKNNIMEMITQEYQGLSLLRNTIEQSKKWRCAQQNASYQQLLDDWHDIINRQIVNIETALSEADILIIQQQVQNADFTWFINWNGKISHILRSLNATYCQEEIRNLSIQEQKINFPNISIEPHKTIKATLSEVSYKEKEIERIKATLPEVSQKETERIKATLPEVSQKEIDEIQARIEESQK